MKGIKTRYTVIHIICATTLIATALALMRGVDRPGSAGDFLCVLGACCALGGAIGVFWNHIITGAALGFVGFIAGLFLVAFI